MLNETSRKNQGGHTLTVSIVVLLMGIIVSGISLFADVIYVDVPGGSSMMLIMGMVLVLIGTCLLAYERMYSGAGMHH